MNKIFWIDSHAHPHYAPLDGESCIKEALQAEIGFIMCVATELKDFEKLQNYKRQFPGKIAVSIGAHPLNEDLKETNWLKLNEMAKDCEAIGETGFDINGDLKIQHEAFDRHAEIALKHDLPMIVHTRESDEETISALKRWKNLKGVLHCFTGKKQLANFAIEQGWKISFSGIITYKKSDELRDLAKYLPLDSLLIETDAPFLAPQMFRGKPNRPLFVKYIGEFLANLRNLDAMEFAKISTKNFFDLFVKASLLQKTNLSKKDDF